MGLTRNMRRIGMAAHTERIENIQQIAEWEERGRKQTRARTMDVCMELRDCMTQEEYNQWWESTPDGDNEFLSAAEDKLIEIKTAADDEGEPIIWGGEIWYPNHRRQNQQVTIREIPF